MDIQRISDELAINSLLTRYARAIDTNDWQLYRSLFTDDAHIDYSAAGLITGTREEVIEFMSRQDGPATGMHYVTNVAAEIDGDTGKASAMWCLATGSPGTTPNRYLGGRWHHDLVRTADGWRSRKLRLEIVWS